MTEHHYRLTTGIIRDGREIAVITRGGHPQIPNSGPCEVCSVGVVDEVGDVNAWFREQVRASPWDDDGSASAQAAGGSEGGGQ